MVNSTEKNATTSLEFTKNDTNENSSTTLSPGNEDNIMADVGILEVLEYVNSALLPTFLILGLIGNFLTIIIMKTRRYSHLTSRLILICLACSDTALLLTQPFNKMFVIKLFGFDMRALTNLGCKIFFIIFKSAKMTSSWCVVLLCIERFTAVWYPLKAKSICSKRNTIIALLFVYIFILTFTSAMSYASQVVNGFCFHDFYDVNNSDSVLLFGSFVIMACIFYSLLPSVIMIILTPLIIYKLQKQKRIRKKMAGTRSLNRDGNKINAMLIGIVIAYIVLVIPNTSLHILSFSNGFKAFGRSSNKGFIIFRDITQILEQLNYAINFFLYVLTSQQFRVGIADLLSLKSCFRSLRTSSVNESQGLSDKQIRMTTDNKSEASSSCRTSKYTDKHGFSNAVFEHEDSNADNCMNPGGRNEVIQSREQALDKFQDCK